MKLKIQMAGTFEQPITLQYKNQKKFKFRQANQNFA